MAKQSQTEENEIETVAREIFAATVIREIGRFNADHIAQRAFEVAEAYLNARQNYRQNTAKPKGVSPDAV